MALGFTPALKAARTRFAFAAEIFLACGFAGVLCGDGLSGLAPGAAACCFLCCRAEEALKITVAQQRKRILKVGRQNGYGLRIELAGGSCRL
jgi:hypothetical protein